MTTKITATSYLVVFFTSPLIHVSKIACLEHLKSVSLLGDEYIISKTSKEWQDLIT